jgi:hypothetical protein
MKIELLCFDGCPSWQTALANLQTALQLERLAAHVTPVTVEDETAATQLRFLGSPSIHLDGKDLWPQERAEYFLSCRMYLTPEGMRGWPTVAMLRDRLHAIVEETR